MGLSTSTNLIDYLNYVTEQLDSSKPVDVLYLDFAKAFDKVPHKRLIQKLRAHKLHPKLIQWMESWLTNRKQRVMVNGVASQWTDVISSVVQGSVLGPILFVIFINDIDMCLRQFEGHFSKFADDTKIAKVVDNPESALEMQTVINYLHQWCKDWQMEFNIDKCNFLHLGFHNQNFVYTMNGNAISSTTSQRDLGIVISDSCQPSNQCAVAAKKANQVLGQINKSFSCYTKDIMLQIYKVFVRPHLEHAVSAWSPWLKKDIEVMESVQRRATRRMSDVQGSYPERLNQLDLTTLEERRKRGDAIEVYKYLHGHWNVVRESLFTIKEGPQTRHLTSYMPLVVPRARLDIRKNFFTVRATNLWNSLPTAIRESRSVNIFKNSYDAYFSSAQ